MSAESRPILQVEDEPTDVEFFQRAQRKAGLTIPMRVVRDGEEAIDYLAGRGAYADRQQHPLPLLIVLDLKLPKRSGLEVLEWMRQQPALGELAVVVMTSSSEGRDVQRARELGALAYLVKPALFRDLVDLVRSIGELWSAMAGKGSSRPDVIRDVFRT